jgi:two-component system phosphate regulon response regulator PhoB
MITLPSHFPPKELIARIKALLRRTAPQKDMKVVKYGNITLNPMTYKVTDAESNIALGPYRI